MTSFRWAFNQNRRGFTIVELLVVVIVVAILAAITVVVYGDIQAQARDSTRRAHAKQITQAMTIYGNKHGHLIGLGSGCGIDGKGKGWFNRGGPNDPMRLTSTPEPSYERSILDCLMDDGLLGPDFYDPRGRSGFGYSQANTDIGYAYMYYNCVDTLSSKRGYFLMKLETIPEEDRMSGEGMCGTTNSAPRQAYDLYQMNYWVEIEI